MATTRRTFLTGLVATGAAVAFAPSASAAAPPRADVWIPSHREWLSGWLYRPTADTSSRRPVIVTAHGLGCIKEMGLDAYARKFVAAGYVVVAFDYRFFAGSTGRPRQLLDIPSQLQDWHAAIAWARQLPGVDPDRVGIFGTSFSGGHVLKVAAADPRVAAVISQCPFTDGAASTATIGPVAIAGAGALATADIAASAVGQMVTIPLAGHPNDVALMNAPDVWDGIHALVPPGVTWINKVGARAAVQIPAYYPGWATSAIEAPTYFAICSKDTVAPPGPTRVYAAKAPNGTVKEYDIGHFDIYLGAPFEEASNDYLRFLAAKLPV
ncbi:prolyl oligopeptidase family serine peptidase [Flexivirga sp. ID2601S]|uniref:Prolyl oligopeptidase family serine peptidase n=1 Tax=Flexivirga aerilata TaxID=1656889 RepID=A0A849AJG6_9MICO|nr:alpha/beta fold hydrolase [Flexivirga aerilata]NNG39977.1 prolyl oligopeptidase family serine peptidase [Flexivirga aerilata]